MKLALAAGGTGGHMFPAQALAEEAQLRGWAVLLLTDARGRRYTEEFPANQVVELQAASPSARGVLAKVRAGRTLLQGISRASRALKAFGADAVVGFGGYPSAPAMMAAQRRRVPTGVHEQNAVLGRANRLAANKAQFLAHGFPVLDRSPRGVLIKEVGNPVRLAVLEAAKTPYPDPSEGPLRVLVFGGSQGASLFARVFPSAMAALPEEIRERLRVTHQVSDNDRDQARTHYDEAGIEAELAPFFSDLPQRLAESHLVIARAGASSVSELSIIGRPSLLVPLKIAMDDHQRMNAEVLVQVGAAERLLEDELSTQSATNALRVLLADKSDLERRAAAAKGVMASGAAVALADLTEDLAAGRLTR